MPLETRSKICNAVGMKADRVEVSRDQSKKQWLIRIHVGAEVIRRHSDESKDAAEGTLRSMAVRVASEEGYSIEPSEVVLSATS
jgi:hypothetical protein